MGCVSSSPDVSNPTEKTNELQKTVIGEKAAKTALQQKKKMKKMQILGAQLPPDYQVKTYPKNDAKKKMIENALLSCKNDFVFKELDKADLAKIVLAHRMHYS